jgi:chemotaxis protein methyltransferase CheR
VVQAQEGIYDRKKLENVRKYEQSYVRRFFEPVEANRDRYKIQESLRNSITFRKFNLKNKQYPFEGTFSLILCRNVLIYFDEEMVAHVIEQLHRSLEPGGYLFVGHTESLQDVNHGLEKVQPAVYRRPKTSRVRNKSFG